MLSCVQIQFKGPSREITILLRNRLTNMRLKLELRNVGTGLKKMR